MKFADLIICHYYKFDAERTACGLPFTLDVHVSRVLDFIDCPRCHESELFREAQAQSMEEALTLPPVLPGKDASFGTPYLKAIERNLETITGACLINPNAWKKLIL